MIIFYHDPCFDGFTAAWCFWTKYGGNATYIPYGFDPIENIGQYANKDVVFVDCCPEIDEVLQLMNICKSFKVLDHHKSNMERINHFRAWLTKAIAASSNEIRFDSITDLQRQQLEKLESCCHFDMKKSGAGLAWKHVWPDHPVPKLVAHVQDRDLWNWALPFTKEITTVLYTYDKNFVQWDMVREELETKEFDNWLIRGKAMMDYHDKLAEQIINHAHPMDIDGHTVPAVCTTVMHSDVAGTMSLTEDFAATYNYDGKYWKFSLRSHKDNPDAVDVSKIAMKFGGGGHFHAAGFKVQKLNDVKNKPTLVF